MLFLSHIRLLSGEEGEGKGEKKRAYFFKLLRAMSFWSAVIPRKEGEEREKKMLLRLYTPDHLQRRRGRERRKRKKKRKKKKNGKHLPPRLQGASSSKRGWGGGVEKEKVLFSFFSCFACDYAGGEGPRAVVRLQSNQKERKEKKEKRFSFITC